MTRANRHLLLLIALMLTAGIASAQSTTGLPPFGSFGGGPDSINLANLNTHWAIPVVHKPGRGTNFSYDLSYDSSIWFPVGVTGSQSWQPSSNWGWAGQTQVATGYIGYSLSTTRCLLDPGPPRQYGTVYNYRNWYYVDEFGTAHGFGYFWGVQDSDCGTSSSGTSTATDGSGFSISANALGPTANITSRSGKLINAPILALTGPASMHDANGNQISTNGTTFTDTLGTAILSVSGSAPSPVSYTYKNTSGTSVPATIYYTTYTVKTNFGVSGISEYGPTSVALVDHITLPNSTQYSFGYEHTPGTCTPLSGTYQG
jgi:hypothetical protein